MHLAIMAVVKPLIQITVTFVCFYCISFMYATATVCVHHTGDTAKHIKIFRHHIRAPWVSLSGGIQLFMGYEKFAIF